MSTAHRNVRWEASLLAETRIRRLDAEALVFNPLSWETQLLTSLSAAVLEALHRSPATAEELAAQVKASLPVNAAPSEITARIREILDELDRLGLARPCSGATDAAR